MSARDYSRGTSVSNLDELDEYGLLTERLEWALLVADSQRFKIECKPPLCGNDAPPRTPYLSRSSPTPMYHGGRSVRHAPSLASLYCVGMLLTISAAQGAWGLACFILAYALWVVRRTRQAVRRTA